MKKKIFSILLRAAISVILILILLYIMRDKYGQIVSAIKGMRAGIFGLALLIFFIATLFASFRLKLLVDAQKRSSVTFLEAVSLTFIGYFFNNFLPTTIGGDVAKAYYLARKTPNKTASFTAVFVDRVMGLFTMIFMAFIALLFVNGSVVDRNVKLAIYTITSISFLIIVFMTNKSIARKFSILLVLVMPLKDKFKDLYDAINGYRHHTIPIVRSLAISVISQLFFFIAIGMLVICIGSRVSFLNILLLVPIVGILSLLPSINGLGLREGSMVLLFGPLIGKGNAFAVSILWFFMLLILSLLGGLVYATSPQFKIPLKELEREP